MLAPGESPVEVEPKVFDVVRLGELYVIEVDWRAGLSTCRKE
jgi:hypothetical protein